MAVTVVATDQTVEWIESVATPATEDDLMFAESEHRRRSVMDFAEPSAQPEKPLSQLVFPLLLSGHLL